MAVKYDGKSFMEQAPSISFKREQCFSKNCFTRPYTAPALIFTRFAQLSTTTLTMQCVETTLASSPSISSLLMSTTGTNS